MYKFLRLTRISIAVIATIALTASVALGRPSFLTRMQLLPAILAGSAAWMLLWLAVTAVFGRAYCSTVCPMGTFMDLCGRLRRRKAYSHRPARNRLRYFMLSVVAICAVAGISAVVSVLDPYSAFARPVAYLGALCGRGTAVSLLSAAVAALTLLTVGAVAARKGRRICNTVCPVGSLLSIPARNSLYHADINTDLCTGCGECARVCKAECIDLWSHTVDTSRCVTCFDCMAVCPDAAITYRRGRHRLSMPLMRQVGTTATAGSSAVSAPARQPIDRRAFVATLAASAGALVASALPLPAMRALNGVTPPAGGSREGFLSRCTGCGACIAACPTGVIRPASDSYGRRRALAAVMDFDRGPCSYDCTACTSVCPTGALTPMTVAEKHRTVIGKARIDAARCVTYTTGRSCGLCARRCPRRAITMEPTNHTFADGRPRRAPQLDFDLCIGCGMCQYVCPATPGKAIVIEGE